MHTSPPAAGASALACTGATKNRRPAATNTDRQAGTYVHICTTPPSLPPPPSLAPPPPLASAGSPKLRTHPDATPATRTLVRPPALTPATTAAPAGACTSNAWNAGAAARHEALNAGPFCAWTTTEDIADRDGDL